MSGVLLRTVARFRASLFRIGGKTSPLLAPIPRQVNPQETQSTEFVRPGIVTADDFASGKLRACSLFATPVWGGVHPVWMTNMNDGSYPDCLEFRCDAHPAAPTLYSVVPSRPMPYSDYLLALKDVEKAFVPCSEAQVRHKFWEMCTAVPEVVDPSRDHDRETIHSPGTTLREAIWWYCQDWYKGRVAVSPPVDINDFPLMESVLRHMATCPLGSRAAFQVSDVINPDTSYLFPRSVPGSAALLARVTPFVRAAAIARFRELRRLQLCLGPLQDAEHPNYDAYDTDEADRTYDSTHYRMALKELIGDYKSVPI